MRGIPPHGAGGYMRPRMAVPERQPSLHEKKPENLNTIGIPLFKKFMKNLTQAKTGYKRTGMAVKNKTHKGAKKRFVLRAGGLIKRKKRGMRHILSNKSSKRKRQLGQMSHVHKSDAGAVKRQLGAR